MSLSSWLADLISNAWLEKIPDDELIAEVEVFAREATVGHKGGWGTWGAYQMCALSSIFWLGGFLVSAVLLFAGSDGVVYFFFWFFALVSIIDILALWHFKKMILFGEYLRRMRERGYHQ